MPRVTVSSPGRCPGDRGSRDSSAATLSMRLDRDRQQGLRRRFTGNREAPPTFDPSAELIEADIRDDSLGRPRPLHRTQGGLSPRRPGERRRLGQGSPARRPRQLDGLPEPPAGGASLWRTGRGSSSSPPAAASTATSAKRSCRRRSRSMRRPLSPYGASKLAVETYLRVYGHLHGLDHGIVRPSNVYGPRQDPKRRGGGDRHLRPGHARRPAGNHLRRRGGSCGITSTCRIVVDGVMAVYRSGRPGPVQPRHGDSRLRERAVLLAGRTGTGLIRRRLTARRGPETSAGSGSTSPPPRGISVGGRGSPFRRACGGRSTGSGGEQARPGEPPWMPVPS